MARPGRRAALWAWWVVAVVLCGGGRAAGVEVDLPRFPSISPDGSEVLYSWRGDLWKVGVEGGAGVRLTAHPGDDLASAWSPDGRTIAFESTRGGRRNIYVMAPDGSGVRQVTFEDANLNLSGFSADSRFVLLSGSIEGEVYRSERVYSVPVAGGPLTRLHGAFGQGARAGPRGERLVFERGGSNWNRRHYRGSDNRDVFLFDRSDGSFTALTSWDGNDGKPRWRNAESVLYLSDRADNTVNLWSVDPDGGGEGPVRLTELTGRDITDFDVSADGGMVVFTQWDGLFVAGFEGDMLGRPERLVLTAPDDAFPKRLRRDISDEVDEAVLSPDGKVMAFVAFGDVFVRAVEEGGPTRRVTDGVAREREIAWSPDMSRLYFVSDRDGTDSIHGAVVSLTRGEIKERFEELTAPAPLEEPVEPSPGEPAPAPEPATAAPEGTAPGSDAGTPGENGEPGDDGAGSEEGEEGEDKGSEVAARWHDAMRFEVVPIVDADFDDRDPRPSPDGTRLAFRRTRGDLVVLDLLTGESRTLVESWDFGTDFRWSPTGGHIAYSADDENFNTDIHIVAADGSTPPVNISRHPDNDSAPRWSEDGRILAFLSEREDDETDVYLVMLDRTLEAYTGAEMEAYFEERAEAVKKLGVIDPIVWASGPVPAPLDRAEPVAPSEVAAAVAPGVQPVAGTVQEPVGSEAAAEPPFTPEDLADAYRRLRRITSYAGNESGLQITPSGERVVFHAAGGAGGVSGVYSLKWDRSEEKLVADGGWASQVSRDGSQVVLIRSGQAAVAPPAGGAVETIAIDYTIDIDWKALSAQKFNELARTLGRTFYHPTMKGLDWAALSEDYGRLAAGAYTAGEFAEVGRRLMGELNASHLGVYPSPDYTAADYRPSGRLGVVSTPVAGGFRVDRVLPRGRTNAGDMRLEVGDVITGIELVPVGPTDTLDHLLAGRAGVETIVTVTRMIVQAPQVPGGSGDADVPPATGVEVSLNLLVTPVSTAEETLLHYEDWQLTNAARVEAWSGGRVGYLHIRSMGGADLNDYERDLYAAGDGKEALIIDVRNNGGGWTADRVLASLMYPKHAYTVPRGADPDLGRGYPRDRLYIQRYNGPVNMLCNQKSFSNAEIISHAFKTLGRGVLVGERTYGGVISTGAFRLVDGTRVRQPFRGWFLPDGTDMENHGAVPDIRIEQTPADESLGLDLQLKAAVDDLLGRLD